MARYLCAHCLGQYHEERMARFHTFHICQDCWDKEGRQMGWMPDSEIILDYSEFDQRAHTRWRTIRK